MDPDNVCTKVVDDLINDAILGVVFSMHRIAKTGLSFLHESRHEKDNDDIRMILDDTGSRDAFGQNLFGSSKMSKAISQLECVCPQCHQSRLACRFAPHLEKCMGMGRNSSRVASRRLAAGSNVRPNSDLSNQSATDKRLQTVHDFDEDDEDFVDNDDDASDGDWTAGGAGGSQLSNRRRTPRKKRGASSSSSAQQCKTPRKRGGASSTKTTPKKSASAVTLDDAFANDLSNESQQSSTPNSSARKMRKTNSLSKFEMPEDILNLPSADSYDPPSPLF